MKTIDETLTAELAKSELAFFTMLELGFSTTLRYTDWDVPVWYDAEKFTPRDYRVTDFALAAALSVDRLALECDNVDRVVSTALLSEDCRGKTVKYYIACNVKNSGMQIVEEVFRGLLDTWTIKGETAVHLEAANELILWQKKTLRTHSSTCPWEFKGTECGYSGEATWCDQSYERCQTLANTDNFGGFRFLPAVSEKEIWWGRIPA